MGPIAWPTLARALAGIVAAAFLLASAILLLYAFRVFGGPPEPGSDFINNVLADFAWEQTVWPLQFAGTALFAIGFLALGGLGPVLAELGARTDGRRGLVVAAFLGAGGLGAASQLILLGAKPVAIGTEYCDCGFLAEEVIARLMAFRIVEGIQTWLVSGAMVTGAVGLVAAASLGVQAGMPAGWRTFAWVAAALAIVAAVLPLFDVYPFDVLLVVLVAGILFPIWVVWLASRAGDVWPNERLGTETHLGG